MYQCQYSTINSSISQCNHKCEIWKEEPEIESVGSCQTRRNLRVDVYASGYGLPRVSGRGFWTGLEPNRLVFALETRTAGLLPGPVANTIYASFLTQYDAYTNWEFSPPIKIPQHHDWKAQSFGNFIIQFIHLQTEIRDQLARKALYQ